MRRVSEIEEAYAAGRRLSRSFSKNITVLVSRTALDLSVFSGNPKAQFYVGNIGEATALSRSGQGGLDHGDTMPGFRKFLHKVTMQMTAAAAVPCTYVIHDYLAFYPFLGMDPDTILLTTGISIPRYLPTDGVQMMLVQQNPYVGGAQVRITYTNQAGVSGRQTPILTLNSTGGAGVVCTSAGAQAGATGDYVALQDGDYGVAAAESIEIISGDVGVLCIVMVKEIATIVCFHDRVPSEWDLWNALGYLPEIRNDAYLNLTVKSAGTLVAASVIGDITTIWRAT